MRSERHPQSQRPVLGPSHHLRPCRSHSSVRTQPWSQVLTWSLLSSPNVTALRPVGTTKDTAHFLQAEDPMVKRSHAPVAGDWPFHQAKCMYRPLSGLSLFPVHIHPERFKARNCCSLQPRVRNHTRGSPDLKHHSSKAHWALLTRQVGSMSRVSRSLRKLGPGRPQALPTAPRVRSSPVPT